MTYANPVYPRPFPDPFVLKHRGEYWGYCTGLQPDGRAFGVIHSRDLVDWRPLAGALEPLPDAHPFYWAPEVSYFDGRFYLYYSVGNEERMEIRVAVADRPAGPFLDAGRRLTAEPFAIDAHVFAAVDGSRWLFYATDFLDSSHVGTGTVRDRLLDPFTLEGNPRPVTLPRYDWHVYHPRRSEKGGVRWHTVEGPFVLQRKGLLYEMFSGGNWQNPTYGVSYATTRNLLDPGEWRQAADGERVLPILRSGGEVVGPGHNSVVRGPDNRQLYCVYHRWSADLKDPAGEGRVLAIDPLDWAGERMLILGPTTTPRPVPDPPMIADLLDAPAVLQPGAEIRYRTGGPSFLVEVSVRGGAALVLRDAEGRAVLDLHGEADESGLGRAFRLLRLEVDGLSAWSSFDDAPGASWRLSAPAAALSLAARETPAELSGFALTAGWEDLFLAAGDPEASGWEVLEGAGWRVEEGRLRGEGTSWIAKGPAFAASLAVVNARLEGGEGYAFAPALAGGAGPRIALARDGQGWRLESRGAGGQIFPLPAAFDPTVDQQFRFRKTGGEVAIAWEGHPLGTVEAPPEPTRLGLGTVRGPASFEAVRVTAL